MVLWCSNCSRYVDASHGEKICCPSCGKVLIDDCLTEQSTFVKGSSGESKLAGNFVRTVQLDTSLSRLRTIKEAENGIIEMVNGLLIDGGDSIVRPAVAFYKIAVERNFTRGRRKEQVQAACLYIACRENKKPYLLIDFSEHLRINVYVLGAVFLQLCKLLSLEEHPIVQKPVDPSLFIHRFTDRLFHEQKPIISRTALQIVASMKRDWMQTGRKPSGLCGAALYISAWSHGHQCTKSDVIKVVHICEATLTKRLIEFENTESGGMTIDEFKQRADELEREERHGKMISARHCGTSKLFCGHDDEPPFAHGLCRRCYKEFIQLSGGLDGGSEPPAFQRAEIQRMRAKEAEDETSAISNSGGGILDDPTEHEVIRGAESSDSIDAILHSENTSNERAHLNDDGFVESDSLSDIDDVEVDFYLHNEEEKQLKKIIWEEMNKEYLEEQAAKEAAEMAAKKAYEEHLRELPEDAIVAKRTFDAAMAKLKKEKQLRRRASEAKNDGPAETAAEATKQILDRKRLSKKVRFDVLEKLFAECDLPIKKSRTETELSEAELSQDAGHVYGDELDAEDSGNPSPVYNGEADLDDTGNFHSTANEELGYASDLILDDF